MKNRNDVQAEKQCEYLISTNRKKLWITELDLLEMLENACKELGISYFMVFGSALGAVRHKGFIPWDDDIDLGMLREDFNKFLGAYQKYFPDYVDVQYGITDNSVDFLMRIRDSRTTGIVRGEKQTARNKGAFIEIYVYDKVRDDFSQNVQICLSKILCSSLAMVNTPNDKTIKGMLRKIPMLLLGKRRLWGIYEQICQWNNKKTCGYVNVISLPKYASQSRFMIDYESVKTYEYANFEYSKARLPVGNLKYLKQLYGDFMALPPVEKRGLQHDNIVFYDPTKSYLEYEDSDIPERYFHGDSSLGLL